MAYVPTSTPNRSSLEEIVPFLPRDIDPLGEVERVSHVQQMNIDTANLTSASTTVARQLYTSHFLSTWNSRVFEFGAVLFLARIFPHTLLPSSVYALVRAGSAICFSPAIGDYIDHGERLRVVRLSLVGQRIAVVVSCFIFVTMAIDGIAYKGILLAVLCMLAAAEKACSVLNLIAIEKDWVVVIAKNSQIDLKTLNSQMRRIDLFSKLLGPLFIALIDGISTIVAIWTVLAMGVIAVSVEYYAIARVHKSIPALQASRNTDEVAIDSDGRTPQANSRALLKARQCYQAMSQYLHHQAFLPSMALSVLYFTVLSFSGQMVTYLVSLDFSSTQIGVMRTVSVVLEMSATWLAPLVIHWVGPVRTGLWSINWQLLCLVPTITLFALLKAPYTTALIMVGGVIVSRIGLWGFDLSVQILVQETVEAEVRGTFSSIEASFQNFFELLAYLSTIVFSRPDQFRYPILMSAVAILIADSLYAKFVVDSRGHLIHLSKCMVAKGESTRWMMNRSTDTRMQDMA